MAKGCLRIINAKCAKLNFNQIFSFCAALVRWEWLVSYFLKNKKFFIRKKKHLFYATLFLENRVTFI